MARVPVRLVAKDLRHAACVFGEEAVTAAVLYAFELAGDQGSGDLDISGIAASLLAAPGCDAAA